MPFGNGKSYNTHADAGEIKGILKDVAVECYFMPGGKMEPVFFKTELHNGEIGSFKVLKIKKRDNKQYNGKLTLEFICSIQDHDGYHDVRLIFFPMECLWKLVM